MVFMITEHASTRIKERVGISSNRSQSRLVGNALDRGIKHCEVKGRLKKWIDSLYFQEKTANNIRLYGDKAYIFNSTTLITVIQVPHNLMKDLSSFKKK